MGVTVNLRILMKNYAVLSERESTPTTWELTLLFVSKPKVHIGFYFILNHIRNVRYWYLGSNNKFKALWPGREDPYTAGTALKHLQAHNVSKISE